MDIDGDEVEGDGGNGTVAGDVWDFGEGEASGSGEEDEAVLLAVDQHLVIILTESFLDIYMEVTEQGIEYM